MKRAAPLLALCLLALPLQAQQKARDVVKWQAFESTQVRFKAEFPAAPLVRKGKLRTEIGDVVSIKHTADSADATYDVTVNEYPKEGIARLTPAKLLDAVRDGLVFQSKGELVHDRPVTMGKVAAREEEIIGKDGTLYRIRLLLVGNRLYQLTAMAKPPALPDDLRFFRSFQLTGTGR